MPAHARKVAALWSAEELALRWKAVWLTGLPQLDHPCTRALGTAERVLQRARAVARQRFHGVRLCHALSAATRSDAFT